MPRSTVALVLAAGALALATDASLVSAQPRAPAPAPAQIARPPAPPRKPVPRKKPRPRKPAPRPALDTCKVDSDCTVYFRTSACIPGDPMAVATAKLALARKTFRFSLIHLSLLFAALLVDHYLIA